MKILPLLMELQKNNFKDYSIERLSVAHYPLLKDLFFDAFGVRSTVRDISKRFDTVKLGSEVIGFIAIHKQTNIAAAYYGVFPMKFIADGVVIQGAQSGDTMTHSRHRKKGFYIELARLTYEECKKRGFKIIMGQPNEQSYHGLVNRLGFRHIDEVIRWDLRRELKTVPLARIARRIGLSGFYLSYARSILKKYITDVSSFNNPIKTIHGKVLRDENYLNYKSSDRKFFIKLNEVTCWINLVDIFWIGDLDNYEKLSPSFLRKMQKIAALLGYNTISLNMVRSIPLPSALSAFRINSKQASCFLYLDKELENKNFLLTAADSDTW